MKTFIHQKSYRTFHAPSHSKCVLYSAPKTESAVVSVSCSLSCNVLEISVSVNTTHTHHSQQVNYPLTN